MKKSTQLFFTLLFIFCILIQGCAYNQKIKIVESGKTIAEIDNAYISDLSKYKDGSGLVPLERVFYKAGMRAIDHVDFRSKEQIILQNNWQDIASTTEWVGDGQIKVDGKKLVIDEIQVVESSLLDKVQFHAEDINPLILNSLDLIKNDQIQNMNLPRIKSQHLVFIYIDALGYLDYEKASQQGLIPNISSSTTPYLGMTTYPSITNVFTASLLTGKEPAETQVDQYGIRQTKLRTFLDDAVSAGLKVTVIEGYSIYFKNLNQGELISTLGKKGVTVSDQDMMVNVDQVLGRMQFPNVLWIHFFGIDDSGHSTGPWSSEYVKNLVSIDGYIGDIIQRSPQGTLFIITSDHGMHAQVNSAHTGTHGNLIAEDMLTFLDIFEKH
jgi:hypothetical protein